ncbi:hypothetical protein [Alienimonas californiensis]|uniref:Uncharacterized protein n=1 Tax=Alienimonas californiensis TaxID=2527989 RepID=A0A517P764_9PLAN|nr:hypothetical protein [Alienimonas californiensis]QDT15226.1 hypothetical protein CA12_13080 [Alienimonas californiensis]
MLKFAALDADLQPVPHQYGNVYQRDDFGPGGRVWAGVDGGGIATLDALAAAFPSERYWVLYVLLVSHAGREPGRYESPLIESREDLQLFLWSFQEFFEEDGRHGIWVGTPDGPHLLVYDRHERLFAYGDADRFEMILKTRGFTPGEVQIPAPHHHGYDPARVDEEDAVMEYWAWNHTPLQPDDDT